MIAPRPLHPWPPLACPVYRDFFRGSEIVLSKYVTHLGSPSTSDRSPRPQLPFGLGLIPLGPRSWTAPSALDSLPSASALPRLRTAPLGLGPLPLALAPPRPRTASRRPHLPLSLGLLPLASNNLPRPRLWIASAASTSQLFHVAIQRAHVHGSGGHSPPLPCNHSKVSRAWKWGSFSFRLHAATSRQQSPSFPFSFSLCCTPGSESSLRTVPATIVPDRLAPDHGSPRF